MRRAARVDDNQAEIVEAFRRCGASVQHLHGVGDDCPDILVGYRGFNALVEIKDGSKPPSRQKLTEGQEKFFSEWRGFCWVVRNIDGVIALLDGMRQWSKGVHNFGNSKHLKITDSPST